MKYLLVPILLLGLSAPSWGQSVTLPKEIKVKENRPAKVTAKAKDKINWDDVVWQVDPRLEDETDSWRDFWPNFQGKVVSAPTAGRYWVKAHLPADASRPLDRASVLAIFDDKGLTDAQKLESARSLLQGVVTCWVIVGNAPDPKPDPKPPEPKPPDPKPPTPVKEFRVLIVVESADLTKLPAKQQLILGSKRVADYLNEKCVKVGNHPEWRIFDKDRNMKNESDVWRKAMELPRNSVPWIVIGNGVDEGHAGPLPATVDDTLLLLKKYGG